MAPRLVVPGKAVGVPLMSSEISPVDGRFITTEPPEIAAARDVPEEEVL